MDPLTLQAILRARTPSDTFRVCLMGLMKGFLETYFSTSNLFRQFRSNADVPEKDW